MNKRALNQKFGSILIILAFVWCSIIVIMPSGPLTKPASAGSTWVQSSDIDFESGIFKNITVVGGGKNAELQLDLLSFNEWILKNPTAKPTPRSSHAMAPIFGTDKVLLFGGNNSDKNQETWIYSLSTNNWINKTTFPSPSAREGHGMAAIHGTDKVLLFGGYYPDLSDTWIYDYSENSWTQKVPSTNPTARSYFGISTIYGTDKVMLYGGLSYPASYYEDTWIYDLSENKWEKRSPTTYPSARCLHGQGSIYNTDKVILFGGSPFHDDTCIYDLSENNWFLMSPTGKPTARFYQVMEAIHGTDKVMLFGGTVTGMNNLAETWIYDLSDNTWKQHTISNFPLPRSLHALATIDGTDMILLFGGWDGAQRDDTWVFKYFLPELEGTYISQPYDTHANSFFNQISWEADIPVNTSIKIQLRSGLNLSDLNVKSFIGPDGNSTTFYNSSPTDIWFGHNGDQYIQYKVYLNTMNFTRSTPSLKDVAITFNCLPSVIIIDPPDNAVITDNKPDFIWTFKDYDSAKQTAFQLLIDDDSEFNEVDYNSGEQTSTEEHWTFPIGTSYTELSDGNWFWKLRARDEDGVWTNYTTPRRLIIDTKIPSSSPVIPDNNAYYYDLNSILGVATDSEPSSGLKQIEITIKNLNSNEYWDGSSWVAFKTWLPTIGTSNWTYDSNQIQWTSGVQYSIQSRAIDNASNIEEPRDEIMFIIDTGTPKSLIDNPHDDEWVNNLTSISGSSLDIGGSGVARVEICIKCVRDNNNLDSFDEQNKYWDGSAWTTNEYWLLAKDTNQWSYNLTRLPWKTCNEYLIQSRAIDRIGNQEQLGPRCNFTYDDSAPKPITININNDDEYSTSTAVTLSLKSEDLGSGTSLMALSVDGNVWSDWQPFNTTKSFYFSGGDGEKSIYFKTKDYAGNIAEPVYDSIILDSTPPGDLSINVNNNAKYTNSPYVEVDLYATDSGSGIGNMSLSSDGINWRAWQTFTSVVSYSLPAGDGEKTVYFKVMDKAGNVIDPISDSIILDTSPPHSLSIQINNGEIETNTTSVNLNLHALDDTSGIYQISLSSDGLTWGPWEDYVGTKFYTMLPGDGKKTVYFKVKDFADNIAEPVSATIILNSTLKVQEDQPEKESAFSPDFRFYMLLILIIIFVILIISMYIILKRKDREVQKLITSGSLTIKPTEMLSTKATAEQLVEPEKPEELPTATAAIGPKEPIPAVPSLPALPPAQADDSIGKPESTTSAPKPAIPLTTPQVTAEPKPESTPTPSEQNPPTPKNP
ncbi:Kelch repeat-containing protein [[Eubacterium] cellulosolvens]